MIEPRQPHPHVENDEYLQEWKQYCEKNEQYKGCSPGCLNIHPSYVLRWIREVEQATNIAKAYMNEVVELREEIAALKAEKFALQQENNLVKSDDQTNLPPATQ